jgi:hypothetical protein
VKRQEGVIAIEASIALVIFTLFILFILGFGNVYKAQNIVSHATLQASQALAIESYAREGFYGTNISEAIKFIDKVLGFFGVEISGFTDSFYSLGSVGNFQAIARNRFALSIAGSEAEADARLRSVGVKDGLDGIDFSDSKIVGSDIIVIVRYNVEVSFLGARDIPLMKSAKSKSFGDIG